MRAGPLQHADYKSIEQIDADIDAKIRAFVRQERRETVGRYLAITLMVLCVAFLWWLTTDAGQAFLAAVDGAR